MTISAKTLSAIQAAGQAIDTARAELAAATQDHADLVMQAVATNPFGAENDHLFNRWKAIARISQSVQDMEAQCKVVFHAAAELAMHTASEGDNPAPMRKGKPSLIGQSTIDLAPSDVVAKPQRAAKKASRKTAVAKAGNKAGNKVGNKVGKAKTRTPRPLKGNAALVLEHLRGLLDTKSFTRVTQSDIASGAGIPNGSIGAALKQLTDKGLLSEGDRGHYKLA
ncbi:hypothetical protein RD110_24900 [Rhodoferax koreense]|uniref:Uncharacterized protein n=1 Tax=Rhodoferax koreensis TaxID=1842727 RepID=A0A1P8K214_9BURK|nr:MarR family transcriptional regulator [Rhodoferax koreense]APW40040.1 hypothetical protein RD110_24900 [Rhodoferax koreense]